MIDLLGFWVSVTLITIPSFFVMAFLMVGATEEYLVAVSDRVYTAKVTPKFENVCEWIEKRIGEPVFLTLFVIGGLGAVCWFVTFAGAGLTYYIDDVSTDFVEGVANISEGLAPFMGWVVIVLGIFSIIHVLLKNFFKIVKKINEVLK